MNLMSGFTNNFNAVKDLLRITYRYKLIFNGSPILWPISSSHIYTLEERVLEVFHNINRTTLQRVISVVLKNYCTCIDIIIGLIHFFITSDIYYIEVFFIFN